MHKVDGTYITTSQRMVHKNCDNYSHCESESVERALRMCYPAPSGFPLASSGLNNEKVWQWHAIQSRAEMETRYRSQLLQKNGTTNFSVRMDSCDNYVNSCMHLMHCVLGNLEPADIGLGIQKRCLTS